MASFDVKKILKDWSNFFLFFMGLGLVAPSLPFWALIFYVFFVPRFLLELVQKRDFFRRRKFLLPLFFLQLCFLSVGGISCISSMFGGQSWKWLIDFSCTVLFLWGFWRALQQPKMPEKIIAILAFLGSLNAFLAFFLSLMGHNLDLYAPQRMAGFGIFHPVIFAGDLAGLSLLSLFFMLFHRLKENHVFEKRDYLFLFLVCFDVFFLFSTGCRMAWGALVIALVLFLKWQKRAMILAGATIVTLVFFWQPACFHYFFARMDSGHIEIWRKTYESLWADGFFGRGMKLQMLISDGKGGFFMHPHSFYLSLLLQGGGVSMVFFLLACGTLLFYGKRDSEYLQFSTFALYALLCGLTDLSFVFKGPSEEWILIWLPLLMGIFTWRREGAEKNLD